MRCDQANHDDDPRSENHHGRDMRARPFKMHRGEADASN
jgi:hypothetical protein